jgi:hypothetical protein
LKASSIVLLREHVELIRSYLGKRPHDEVGGACSWLDQAMAAADAAKKEEKKEEEEADG